VFAQIFVPNAHAGDKPARALGFVHVYDSGFWVPGSVSGFMILGLMLHGLCFVVCDFGSPLQYGSGLLHPERGAQEEPCLSWLERYRLRGQSPQWTPNLRSGRATLPLPKHDLVFRVWGCEVSCLRVGFWSF
jgi:hypothetical protein